MRELWIVINPKGRAVFNSYGMLGGKTKREACAAAIFAADVAGVPDYDIYDWTVTRAKGWTVEKVRMVRRNPKTGRWDV